MKLRQVGRDLRRAVGPGWEKYNTEGAQLCQLHYVALQWHVK